MSTGAHSWVRKAIGIQLEGSQTDSIWGVVDLTLDTDFPDTRAKSLVNSVDGTLMIIPREKDKNRIYVQLEGKYRLENPARQGRVCGRSSKAAPDPDKVFTVAQQLIKPFRLEKKSDFEWSTIYTGETIITFS